MKIAYLCADFGIPIRGYKGASVHVREMVAALSALGHEVRIFSPHAGAGNAPAAPLEAVEPQGWPEAAARLARRVPRRHPRLDKEVRELAYNLTLYRHLRSRSAHWRPDAIYERYSLYNLAGLALARRLRVPHLLEVNAPLRLERARTKGLALSPVARCVERRLFGSTDALLAVSTMLNRYAQEHGAHPERTLTLPNAVDTLRFHPGAGASTMRARLGLAPEAVVIGFAGSLKPWHGTDTLLEAFASVRAEVPMARLLIVGEGPQGDDLRDRATHLGLGTAVVFTGKVDHNEMPAMLSAMDVGVAPYLNAPDFYFSPLKLYEYMAAGLCVIASDAGEIHTLVRDGQTGLLYPPGDSRALAILLKRTLHDAPLRTRLGVAARVEAERHTWQENARTVVALADTLSVGRRTQSRAVVPEGERS